VPIAIGAGAGAELRQPLGIAVVGVSAYRSCDAVYHAGGLYLSRSDRPRLKRRLEPKLDEVENVSGRTSWRGMIDGGSAAA